MLPSCDYHVICGGTSTRRLHHCPYVSLQCMYQLMKHVKPVLQAERKDILAALLRRMCLHDNEILDLELVR